MYTMAYLDRDIAWLKEKIKACEEHIRAMRTSTDLRIRYAGYKAELEYLEELKTDLSLQ